MAADRVRLLAGSHGPERVAVRPDPDDADWYLPLHLRDPVRARERIASQVAAGADVVVAPTWLTHRRALLPVGETRSAGAWTAAAVSVAREGVEVGAERRAEELADVPDDDVRHGRPTPLVAASLPGLDATPEPGTGRLLPREAAADRDYRDQAGYLADAEPDLVLVEGQVGLGATRAAVGEAVQTGLPTWLVLGEAALAAQELEAWLEVGRSLDVAAIVLPPPLEPRLLAADGPVAWGGLVSEAGAVADWLAAGASIIARLDGATPAALRPLRSAIDDHERGAIEAARTAERSWAALVARAAAIAPGGAALCVGDPPSGGLAPGFAWLVVVAEEVRRLPRDHYRLVIADRPTPGLPELLEHGGVLALGGAPLPVTSGLRLLDAGDSVGGAYLYRRED